MCGMIARLLAFFILFANISSASITRAENHASTFPVGNFSEMKSTGSATVSMVIDPLTVALDDKRIVRLSGIDFPDYNPNMPGSFSETAIKVLKDMLEGKKVNVYQTPKAQWGRSNRFGQQIAHLELQKGNKWVQGTLLRLGLARTMTDIRTPEMASQMYALEKQARHENIGVWLMQENKILTPEEASNHTESLGIVEGKVLGTAMKQNRTYLNFGKNWKTDFTIVINPDNRRQFFDRNIDPQKYNGKILRVRGWIGDYNGPFIEVDHPEQIEVIENK